MNFDEKKDLYLRNTHSARINRIKNIFADERKANTVSHNRISKVINNSDNELTPSHNNRNNNTYSENNIWLTPNKDINNTNNKLKSKNLIFNEDNQKNEYRNDLLYKSELDDEGYIDNENDIFNFSRLNKRNKESISHFQKLNREMINYIKRKTPTIKDTDISSDQLQSYSIFTTPLAKRTAEKFGMSINETNTQKKKYTSLNANLFYTPERTSASKNVLSSGSKSVNYITKIDYNSPFDYNLKKSSMQSFENIFNKTNDNKIDYNSPFNYNLKKKEQEKNLEKFLDNKKSNTTEIDKENILDINIINDKNEEEVEENKVKENKNSQEEKHIEKLINDDKKEKTQEKNIERLIENNIEKEVKKNNFKNSQNDFDKDKSMSENIFGFNINSLTPNRPTISKGLFTDSLIKRKSYSANPIRINKKLILGQLNSSKKINRNSDIMINRFNNNSKISKTNKKKVINKSNLSNKNEKSKKSNITSKENITSKIDNNNNSNSTNRKNQKRKGVLTELKRKIDPITGIISKLSVIEDPDTGETTRIITSYDPITGNKTETKTITTTTTTMTTTTQSTTTRKTTTIDRENNNNNNNNDDDDNDIEEEGIINEEEIEKETDDEVEIIDVTDNSSFTNSDEDYESISESDNIFKRMDTQNSNSNLDFERKTPQKNNKRFIDMNLKKNGSLSVPYLYNKKFKLNEPFSLKIPPYTVNSKVVNDDQGSFNNIPTVGKLSLSNIDLNSPKYNNKDLLSNYPISKNRLDLSVLKKQYKLEQEINNHLLNTEKPKSKFAECEEAIGNLLSKWSKKDEEKNETEREDNEDEFISFNTNIKIMQEEIQKKIEKNRKLNEEINNKSLKFSNKIISSNKENEPLSIEVTSISDEKEENKNINEIKETDISILKPFNHSLPDFIFSGNNKTPSRISSNEILSSKKSSQLIQKLQDDFIKNHKHTRSPGIDFSSYRLSAKKPRLSKNLDLNEDNNKKSTNENDTFIIDKYDDNPFISHNTPKIKKQLSTVINIDREDEQSEKIKTSLKEKEYLLKSEFDQQVSKQQSEEDSQKEKNNKNNLLELADNRLFIENSPLSIKSINHLSQIKNKPIEEQEKDVNTVKNENKIVAIDKTQESDIDIDLISVGDSSDSENHYEHISKIRNDDDDDDDDKNEEEKEKEKEKKENIDLEVEDNEDLTIATITEDIITIVDEKEKEKEQINSNSNSKETSTLFSPYSKIKEKNVFDTLESVTNKTNSQRHLDQDIQSFEEEEEVSIISSNPFTFEEKKNSDFENINHIGSPQKENLYQISTASTVSLNDNSDTTIDNSININTNSNINTNYNINNDVDTNSNTNTNINMNTNTNININTNTNANVIKNTNDVTNINTNTNTNTNTDTNIDTNTSTNINNNNNINSNSNNNINSNSNSNIISNINNTNTNNKIDNINNLTNITTYNQLLKDENQELITNITEDSENSSYREIIYIDDIQEQEHEKGQNQPQSFHSNNNNNNNDNNNEIIDLKNDIIDLELDEEENNLQMKNKENLEVNKNDSDNLQRKREQDKEDNLNDNNKDNSKNNKNNFSNLVNDIIDLELNEEETNNSRKNEKKIVEINKSDGDKLQRKLEQNMEDNVNGNINHDNNNNEDNTSKNNENSFFDQASSSKITITSFENNSKVIKSVNQVYSLLPVEPKILSKKK